MRFELGAIYNVSCSADFGGAHPKSDVPLQGTAGNDFMSLDCPCGVDSELHTPNRLQDLSRLRQHGFRGCTVCRCLGISIIWGASEIHFGGAAH